MKSLPGELVELLRRQSAINIEQLTSGGSASTVLRFDSSGSTWVLKYQEEDGDLVDGHDLASFRRKARQLDLIRADAPQLARRYIGIDECYEGTYWSAHLMPYIDATPLPTFAIENHSGPQEVLGVVGTVLEDVAEYGWLRHSSHGHWDQADEVQLRRIERRTLYTRERIYLPDAPFLVNGIDCFDPRALAETIRGNSRLRRLLSPERLFFPAHGDLNMRNILVGRGAPANRAFWLIDPRGSLRLCDPTYDLAKLLLSPAVFEPAMRGGFRLERPGANGMAYRLTLPESILVERQVAAGFLDYVESTSLPVSLSLGNWRWRVLFGLAFHAIAESACRLSVAGLATHQGVDPTEESRALGFWLLGTGLLNQLVRASNEHDEPPSLEALMSPFWEDGTIGLTCERESSSGRLGCHS